MLTVLLAVFLMLAIVAIMAVGVLMGRKPIAGSCGGVGAALQEKDYVCDLCGGDEAKCEELKNGEGQNSALSQTIEQNQVGLYVDASQTKKSL